MKLLATGNKKLKVLTFGLPAVKTCPQAEECKKGCYATQGRYVMRNVVKKRADNYEASQCPMTFMSLIEQQLNSSRCRTVRIHDSGDFYSYDYLTYWLIIASQFPDHTFYCYTKSVSLFREAQYNCIIPDNFKFAFSYGGKEDHMISRKHDRFVEVFDGEIPDGYTDLTDSDLPLYTTGARKFGIRYHGAKKFTMELKGE